MRVSGYLPDKMSDYICKTKCQRKYQNICEIKSQMKCQIRFSLYTVCMCIYIYEKNADRISEYIEIKSQMECQNI